MRLTRENYLKMIRPYYEADLIKVITGVRRAGKSVILESIRDELSSSGIDANHIVYINLEDMDYEGILDASDLNREIKAHIVDGGRYYLFIDEIQHVDNLRKHLLLFVRH